MLPIKQLTLGFVAIATAISMSPPAAAQERACPYIRCFLSIQHDPGRVVQGAAATPVAEFGAFAPRIDLLANGSDRDRKSTRLNSSHRCISYAVFCLKK